MATFPGGTSTAGQIIAYFAMAPMIGLSVGLGCCGLLTQSQRRKGLPNFHNQHRHKRTGGAAEGLLHQRGRSCPTGEGDHQHRGAGPDSRAGGR
jgi:hypothetical protein